LEIDFCHAEVKKKDLFVHDAGRFRRCTRWLQRAPNWDRVLGRSGMCECWISRSVYASTCHTAMGNRAGERVAELIFPLSLNVFQDRKEMQRTVEKNIYFCLIV